ncbi:NACHT and WD domain-containing protein, variant [Amylocarpus encephaloides]|uniref:GPI inositol-deacylase n=1 Tax=Amylocarpus encephaloides TaxID=45428 RepID=A0A9P7YDU1_9HELO|nr:NACHT and WD domain-containing protein, variant [Amylocarpus encephaloides]
MGDIIFVHGLGGTAMRTWSWKRDTTNFWPAWLTEEKTLSRFRIFSFGYNSNFKGAATNLNTIDFAKELLFSMLTHSGSVGEKHGGNTAVGARPIIFVAHSMGGLVVKKACVLGQHDKQYSSLVSQIYGILFLGTPHRGAQYAKMLNILSSALTGSAPKDYVADLDIHSTSLQDINEQFRTTCDGFELASFFETQKTSFGITKLLIVEKESAVLGYPQETSIPLNADHHNLCKFESRGDPNYTSVKNLIKHWASKISLPQQGCISRQMTGTNEINVLREALGIRETADMDLDIIQNNILGGSGEWITQRQDFIAWHQRLFENNPAVFWLIGLPATGKTAIATTVINHLQLLGHDTVFHLFTCGHQQKKTASYCLRSIALQIAKLDEEFLQHISHLIEESGSDFGLPTNNFDSLWEKVFCGLILKMNRQAPLFFVLDGLDEADLQTSLLGRLLKIQSRFPIRIFLTSRPMKVPLAPPGISILPHLLMEKDTADDINAYVQRMVQVALPDDSQIQEEVIQEVLNKASGSFLWVKLTLETLQDSWHTKEDIRAALSEVPKGMELLYGRMLEKIKAQSQRTVLIARRILTLTICCWRPLTLIELQKALEPEFQGFVRLEHTIAQICGHFISVDNSKIFLVHGTARNFLLSSNQTDPPFVDRCEGHELLATACFRTLSNDQWRLSLKSISPANTKHESVLRDGGLSHIEKAHPLLRYAACHWAYHLSRSSSSSEPLIGDLKSFLGKNSLSWIEAIATLGTLSYIVRAARYLKAYAKQRSQGSGVHNSGIILSLRELPKDETKILQSWANDFIRLVGKFGKSLVQHPSSIRRLIIPFCPKESAIATAQCHMGPNSLTVTGLPLEGWGDCLARVTMGDSQMVSKVLATDRLFFTLASSSGTIIAWSTDTCEEIRRLEHHEYVLMMVVNISETRLATAGFSGYRIWDIFSGAQEHYLPKWTEALTITIMFGQSDSQLLIGLDDCTVTTYELQDFTIRSRFTIQEKIREALSCPHTISISPNRENVAVAWRGKPLMVWDMTQDALPQSCQVNGNSDSLMAPEQVLWQNNGNSILILCLDSKLFEWNLYDEEQFEYGKYHDMNAREMALSSDGTLLLTSDNFGTMSVWSFPRLQLIYRLINSNEYIRALTFSPSAQRFYGTRDSTCNVWEPDALVHPETTDLADSSSIAESYAATEPVVSKDESSENQVTALATSSDDRWFCCGKEDGSVIIHDAQTSTKIRKVCNYTAASAVILLEWSKSGRYIVSSDESGRVISKRLEVKEPGKWTIYPGLDARFSEPVLQFVFSADEKLLLMSLGTFDCVWDLKSKNQICQQYRAKTTKGKWVADPINAEILLWIDENTIYQYEWLTLMCNEADHSHVQIPCSMDCMSTVRKVALTSNSQTLVYELAPNKGIGSKSLRVLSISSLSHSWEVDLLHRVKSLIGVIQNRIVFLDDNNWVCTWEIEAGNADVRHQFCLPSDLLNASTLELMRLSDFGSFFCPRLGNVVVVRHGLRL